MVRLTAFGIRCGHLYDLEVLSYPIIMISGSYSNFKEYFSNSEMLDVRRKHMEYRLRADVASNVEYTV